MYEDMFKTEKETAWCPGCGNFGIINALKQALNALKLKPSQVVISSGIGQAAKLPHYINVNGFNGLHGRALPVATGIKIANKDLVVIVNSGEGDTYGEGGNHFIHTIRRNINIAHFVHNNQVYGLTKGQASPTSDKGFKTGVQTGGVINEPFNPIAAAISLGAGFVARSFSGDIQHLKWVMKEAINYKGYALVDILQPCISFNKVNTFKYYKDRIYYIDKQHDTSNINKAYELSLEWGDRIPIGIFYKVEKPDYLEKIENLKEDVPLVERTSAPEHFASLMDDFR